MSLLYLTSHHYANQEETRSLIVIRCDRFHQVSPEQLKASKFDHLEFVSKSSTRFPDERLPVMHRPASSRCPVLSYALDAYTTVFNWLTNETEWMYEQDGNVLVPMPGDRSPLCIPQPRYPVTWVRKSDAAAAL